jgi:hypothetical protein
MRAEGGPDTALHDVEADPKSDRAGQIDHGEGRVDPPFRSLMRFTARDKPPAPPSIQP